MALKDILVHVNSSKHCGARLELAVWLAQTYGAHLTGLYTIPEFYVPAYVAAQLPPEIMKTQRAIFEGARAKAKAEFEARMAKAGIESEWREADGDPAEMAALNAHYSDLVVVGQNDPDEEMPDAEFGVAERVLLDSGRPTLIVPYAGSFKKVGERVLVAWNASAPASRAVADALPLMAKSKKVTVLAVNPTHGPEGHGDVPGADISLHLARHDIKAEASHIYADDVNVGDMILSRAADEGVDLIVMGAYGHARVRELVLGGATRTILDHMTVPVLMSH